MILGMLSQRLAQHVHRLREVALLDHDIGPYRRKQRLLLDDLARVLDQVEQRAERFGCELERFTGARAQNTMPGIELKLAELVEVWPPLFHPVLPPRS